MAALEDYIPAMQGLSLRNVTLRIRDQRGRELYREFGEMLFTHFGVSGPLVLTASSLVGKKLAAEGTLAASIDPVSYTHLDVYKRQDEQQGSGRGSCVRL